MDPEDYSAELLSLIADAPTEVVPRCEAHGRTLADAVTAPHSLPTFPTSAMDGYALDRAAFASARAGEPISVTGDIPAGHPAGMLSPGTAVRIMTGSRVPTTADVVIPVELTDASRTGVRPDSIRISGIPADKRSGWNIRAVGEDTHAGDIVIPAGRRLNAAAVGVLAMLGIESARVLVPRRIGIVVTGDEVVASLADPSGDPVTTIDSAPFVLNSNLPMLAAAVRSTGSEPVCRTSTDDPDELMSVLGDLAPTVDLIITTGGISAGAFEVVRQTLEGTHSTFLRVGIRPGGPQGWGRFGDTPLLHFPGTPAGAALAFELFARSMLRRRPLSLRWRTAIHRGVPLRCHPRAISMVPGRWTDAGEVEALSRSRLRDFAGADVIIRVPRGVGSIDAGELIRILPI